MTPSPAELRKGLNGLLGFPVTPFTPGNRIDLEAFRMQVRLLLNNAIQAIFPVAGTGEFFSLSLDEYAQAIHACVAEVAGRVPVIAPVGYGAAMACEFAQIAQKAGASGLLALPPYLIAPDQDGLEQHYRSLASSTSLGLILYQRDNAVFAPETIRRLAEVPNIIGLKDGLGQLERLQLARDALEGRPFVFLNGMPTAEAHARAFAAVGITTYSSAILNFVPEIAKEFYLALTSGETQRVDKLLHTAILPLVRLRNHRQGYAISMIKCGARLRGLQVGRVRPPLTELSPQDEVELVALLRSWNLSAPLVVE